LYADMEPTKEDRRAIEEEDLGRLGKEGGGPGGGALSCRLLKGGGAPIHGRKSRPTVGRQIGEKGTPGPRDASDEILSEKEKRANGVCVEARGNRSPYHPRNLVRMNVEPIALSRAIVVEKGNARITSKDRQDRKKIRIHHRMGRVYRERPGRLGGKKGLSRRTLFKKNTHPASLLSSLGGKRGGRTPQTNPGICASPSGEGGSKTAPEGSRFAHTRQ